MNVGPTANTASRLHQSERISALPQASTRMPRNKVWVIPIIRLALTQASQRLFARPDARARQYGWEVTVVQRGWGRRYRDPRFGTLSRALDAPSRNPGVPARGGGIRA